MKKIRFTCLLLTLAFWSATGVAAEAEQTAGQTEVQQDLESIVANCEKKKLPVEQEIECIEKGYLQFMGAVPPEES